MSHGCLIARAAQMEKVSWGEVWIEFPGNCTCITSAIYPQRYHLLAFSVPHGPCHTTYHLREIENRLLLSLTIAHVECVHRLVRHDALVLPIGCRAWYALKACD